MENREEIYEIDVLKLIALLWKKAWIIVIIAIIAAFGTFAGTRLFVTPQYTASALLYVNSNSISLGNQKLSISSGELSTAKALIDTYGVILKTRLTLEEVIETADLPYSYEELSSMISTSSVNGTEVFRISVVDPDSQEACLIANTIAQVLPKKISTIVEGSSVKTVDLAVVPTSVSSPNYTRNALLGFVIGALATAAIIVFTDYFKDTLQDDAWLVDTFGSKYPLLANIPDSAESFRHSRYKYYSKYSRYSYKSHKPSQEDKAAN